ncbi:MULTISPECIES: 5'/3'-nucleotidase SurE [unclassified Azospirillum]|uniref:5'/3'-nucleotidase SurE n=1 Tax=unclassified Azospirillum TaxID=2630922 RepID=UPI000B6F946D|nr:MULTISPECIES: 5'/3'-nucleotidase SurE [unclassified Azospirillum]SNT04264.1 5'-nucleotidase /3'-nucleotidase /exopolyphosphatase [Azospirillum sp. RU38E]SNT19878.1 5'-nucleotidase /3'-nucleotidase /exopolyphosphatase [Azospirillum sp. RU37A]
MSNPSFDFTGARILVSNDDGIHAAGLGVLEQIARSLTDDVWVVAPETEQSGASHSLTMHRPLRLREVGPKRYTVDGTPTDCVLLAINHLMQDRKPTLVLSGINHGSNLGEDVTYSGTIACAMEATLLGVRAIAMSQRTRPDSPPDWSVAERHGADIVRKIMAVDWPRHVLMNVNYPAVPPDEVTGVHVVRHGNRKIGDELDERIDPRGRRYFWIGMARGETEVPADTDVHVVSHGGISVTPIYLDLTHYACLEALKGALA